MNLHLALAAAAALVALAFGLCTWERYLARRRRHELMWTIALGLFALASAALWLGAAVGWAPWNFRLFYLFGAILNVPFLALGTVYLLGGTRRGDIATAVVSVACAFAAGVLAVAPSSAITDRATLPSGKDVYGLLPRILGATYSGVAATVIVVGAVWSAVRLLRGRRRPGAAAAPGPVRPGRLAAANILIAVGTVVTGASGVMNGVLDQMDAFSVLLVAGISLIFGGFLLTNTAAPTARPALRSLSWLDEEPGPTRSSESA